MKRMLALFALLCCLMSMWAQEYKTEKDILYTDSKDAYAQERCRLDVYYPTDRTDCPVVVWFHGGGLEGGSKFIPQELQRQGIVVIAANYRFITRVTIKECCDDAAAAVAWAMKHAEQYGGSHRKVVVSGHSAGGYLTDMVGLDKRYLAKYGVDADSIVLLAPFSAQVITHYNERKKQGIGPLQPVIDDSAPIAHLRAEAPPIMVLSGDRELELYGRYEEQAYFWRMLRLVGHPDATLYEMQGHDHGAMPGPAFHVMKQKMHQMKLY